MCGLPLEDSQLLRIYTLRENTFSITCYVIAQLGKTSRLLHVPFDVLGPGLTGACTGLARAVVTAVSSYVKLI